MADPGLLVIRRSCCRANTAPSRTSAVGSTARSSNRSRRAHPSPPRGIPCRLGYRAINWRGYRAAQRCGTQRAPFCLLCARRRCMRKRGRVTAGAELLRLNRPGSTSPGGKLQCGRYWTRRGAPGMRPVGRAPHVWHVASGSHSPYVPHPASASATPAFPARARWKMAPAPGRPPPAWLGVRVAQSPLPAGPCPVPSDSWDLCPLAAQSPTGSAHAASEGRQHCHARAGPVGS